MRLLERVKNLRRWKEMAGKGVKRGGWNGVMRAYVEAEMWEEAVRVKSTLMFRTKWTVTGKQASNFVCNLRPSITESYLQTIWNGLRTLRIERHITEHGSLQTYIPIRLEVWMSWVVQSIECGLSRSGEQ
ncbi:hypothetical protein SUGI_1048030 [Cryptomeria japonica]|nr:hypothetical protein SUGI_1048030 [Cryptomeria japonica]